MNVISNTREQYKIWFTLSAVAALLLFAPHNCIANNSEPLQLYQKGDFGIAEIRKIRPLVASIDSASVATAKGEFLAAKNQGKRQLTHAIISMRPKVVLGPNQELYLVSGYSQVRALMEMGVRSIQIEVIDDFSSLESQDFMAQMKQLIQNSSFSSARFLTQLPLRPSPRVEYLSPKSAEIVRRPKPTSKGKTSAY